LAFLGAGMMKLSRPKVKLRERMTWDSFPESGVKLVGAAEVLGALGLILPAATGIAPILTPIAAIGLVIVMIGAVITHVRLKVTSLCASVVTQLSWPRSDSHAARTGLGRRSVATAAGVV
jgi:hypothetical protein